MTIGAAAKDAPHSEFLPVDIRVWRGRLRVRDGIGHNRREALVHRATGHLRRLVVLGHTGSISLEAICWLADVGASYLQLDADGPDVHPSLTPD